jgi:chromosome segregation ATPase
MSSAKQDAEYWKEQHTIIARDIARYQATNAANAVTIEGLEAQLAAEKIKSSEASHLAASKDTAIDIERRNYSSVQDVLGSTRKELEEMGAKWRANEVEIARLRALMSDFETERKTWSSLQEAFMDAKVKVEQMLGQLGVKDAEIATLVKEIEMLKQDKKAWEILQETYMTAKAEFAKLSQDKAEVDRQLASALEKITALEREKLELIGSLTCVSKEYEGKHDKFALERKREVADIQRKVDELTAQVLLPHSVTLPCGLTPLVVFDPLVV